MTVILKPVGRGNWAPLRIVYSGAQVLPLFVKPGDRMTFAGVTWRVHRVLDGPTAD